MEVEAVALFQGIAHSTSNLHSAPAFSHVAVLSATAGWHVLDDVCVALDSAWWAEHSVRTDVRLPGTLW